MAKTITFLLPPRMDPAPNDVEMEGIGDIPEGRYSRHHIVGRKYLQMLTELLEQFEFVTYDTANRRPQDYLIATCDERVKRFAKLTWERQAQDLKKRIFWSPWNLFVGPSGLYRIFDPNSGVEQVRPKTFSTTRWNALKQIPTSLEVLGVNLGTLATMDDGASLQFTVKMGDEPAKKVIGDLLTRLDEATSGTGKNKVGAKPHRFIENEWAVVDTQKDRNKILQVTSYTAAENQYRHAVDGSLIDHGMTWAQVSAQTGQSFRYKMIIIST